MESRHEPVLCEEVIAALDIRPEGTYVDATLGLGGHAEAVLRSPGFQGRLIGIDADPESLRLAQERLVQQKERLTVVQGNFADLQDLLAGIGVRGVDGVLFDLGISSYQLGEGPRGFGFQTDGPLDMRMDQTTGEPVSAMINSATTSELVRVFRDYGEERFAQRIAEAIVRERLKSPLLRCDELRRVIEKAVSTRGKIHPATRVFQALRICVNHELENLKLALEQLPKVLKPGGRAVVISFHSLEDRAVKTAIRQMAWHAKRNPEGILKILTRKPAGPTEEERRRNPRSRSAKLRAAERI